MTKCANTTHKASAVSIDSQLIDTTKRLHITFELHSTLQTSEEVCSVVYIYIYIYIVWCGVCVCVYIYIYIYIFLVT